MMVFVGATVERQSPFYLTVYVYDGTCIVTPGLPLNSVRVSMVGVCFSVAAVTLTGITSADNATYCVLLL